MEHPAQARLRRNKELRRQRMVEARKKGTHTTEQWEALKAEFGHVCLRCGRQGYHLDKDHIVPVYQGGSDGIENIQPLCAWCNAGKGPDATNWVAIRREEREAGVPHHFEPMKQAKR